ncbi:type II toxin-antitoxin system prevent-host-death family antitoxin (plasmid) [Streptomyces sp. NBC_01454]|uniref:type II toxin-antitoxin system prevent-host-death family antitoxin n=2 Tax=unclassified Streptomyces TaxID=2593676 RepID=UPI002E380BCC|nr:type II toxin-antitoxin system prevent-host-death family antitoxin [Streptomyces sp. NBC_01454]
MSSSRSVSAANTGAATGLLLPPADDPVWGSVPLALRQNLSVPAHGLVNPARGGLAEKSGRPLRLALSAAANMRTTGAHWHVLLIAPRSAFGGPTSDRAGRAYALLQQVVDDYLRPALAAPAKASGKAPAEQPPTAPAPASTPAAPAAVPAEPPAAPESADGFLPDPAAAPDTVSAAGPEGGAVEEAPNPLPAADEPAAAELAGDELAGALHEITERRTVLVLNSPHPDVAHTALAQHLPAGQPAVSVAGDDRASMVRALYTQLGLGRRQRRPHALGDTEDLIVAELKRAPRLIIATTAPGLRASALQLLYSLWARENFALVLIGDTNLTTLLSRSDMASLNSRVTLRHHVAPTSPDTPAPSGTTPAEQQDPRPAEPATTPAPPDTSPPADPAALAAPADDAAADPAVTGDPRTAPEPASTAHGEELADHVREIAQARAILTVTGPDATTVHTALTRTPSLPNLPAVHTGGKDRTSLVRDLFVQLGLDQRVPQPGTLWATEDLIAAELRRASRLVIVPKAHELPTAALRMLYDLWSADNFPLVLGGDDRLDDVLQRRALASLSSCVLLHHHLDPAGEDAPISTPAAALVPPAPEPGATAAPSAAGPEPATAPPTPTTPSAPDRAAGPLPATDALTAPQEQPAPRAADTAPAPSRPAVPPSHGAAEPPAPATLAPAADSDQPATTTTEPAPPPGKTKAVPGKTPATLHQARAALPDLIRAAADGTPTPLTREDTDHALLTTPDAATALGWDLEQAPAHGIADARKKLGDLIHEAAQGHPQVLRRHTTPVAVLLPATPTGTPHPPTTPAPTTAAPPATAAVPPTGPTPVAEPTGPAPTGAEPAPSPQPARTTAADAAPAPAEPNDPTPAEQHPHPAPVPPATDPKTAPDTTDDTPAAAALHHAPTDTAPAHTGVPAAPRASRRLAPLGEAFTTVLAPTTPDTEPTTDTVTSPRGLSTGIPSLDHALGGLQPGRFYLVAAAPGTGGSLLATTAARTTALDHHQPVLYAASGLTRADIAARIVAAHLPVDYRRLRAGQLTDTEQADVAALHHDLATAPLYIDDGTDLTAAAIAETLTDLTGTALLVVDRLQAADDPHLPLSGPRLRDAAQTLAHLARTHHLPVLAALDTDHPDLINTLGLDTVLHLTPDPDHPHHRVQLAITERDLGLQTTLTLHADRAHARLTDPTDFDPYAHAPEPPEQTAPEPTPQAPAAPGASAWPPVAVPGRSTPVATSEPTSNPHTPAPEPTPDPGATTTDPTPHHTQPPRTTASSGTYAGRDYSHYTGQITRAVDQALQEHGGDVEAATAALVKKAVPDAMALFKETRVGSNYDHTVYPELLEILRKKTKDGSDEIWEGRHNWTNTHLTDQLNTGALDPVTVDALDTNASFMAAFKTHLPIGALRHNPHGGFDPKLSGVHLLTQRPTWHHPHLPDPIGNRRETGPVVLTDATIRLLIRCARYDLCDQPVIAESWTSGASEGLLEKFRRVLTEARHTALEREAAGYADGTVAVEYVKAMYSKFTSTLGESNANLEIRRPEWMHTIRSQAFANLWYKAHRAHKEGLTVVRVRGTDELHVTGGDWRTVFTEGRSPAEMKLKNQYTLPRKTTA